MGGRNLKYPPIAISVASYDAKDINFISKKSVELIEKIISSNTFVGKVININFPDIDQNEFKGVLATGLSKRDVPAKPIKVDESSSNTYRYRYNLSGEPLEDKYMTDAEAVKNGYVSISVLDYSLNSGNFIEEITQVLDE
jgi:5'-nucleotidase